MFLGLLLSNIIGGIIVGLISDKPSHVIVFSLFWVLISLISLFIFQKNELLIFESLVKRQEIKYSTKTRIDSRLIWVVITGLSSFLISFLIGMLIVSIK